LSGSRGGVRSKGGEGEISRNRPVDGRGEKIERGDLTME